jgi:hypothetical protein
VEPGVDLFWLPLGAGGRSVRLNGKAYEALAAARARRPRLDLYHSALVVATASATYAIESAPASPDGNARGVVGRGAVGSRLLRPVPLFRYEVRCWRDGVIPDLAEAVDSPRRLSGDAADAQRILDLAPSLPTPVWGRDELGTGEMWSSNSVVSWLLAQGGLDVEAVAPPAGGRAPGWGAGIVEARRRPS